MMATYNLKIIWEGVDIIIFYVIIKGIKNTSGLIVMRLGIIR